MNIAKYLKHILLDKSDYPAIYHRKKVITFLELDLLAGAYQKSFEKKNIGANDPILIFIPMSITLYACLLATFASGYTAVFADAWANSRRLNQVANHIKLKAVIAPWYLFPILLLSSAIRKIPVKMLPINGTKFRNSLKVEDVEPSQTALITFTTGSTGIPKGANRTHDFLISQHLKLKSHLNLPSDKTDAPFLPIFVLNNLAQGISSLIPGINPSKPAKFNAKELVSELHNHQINSLTASPAIVEKIADYLITSKTSLPDLKKIFMGGAVIFPSSALKIRQAFPHSEIEIVYGSTEAEPIFSCSVDEYLNNNTKCFSDGFWVGRKNEDVNLEIIQWKPTSWNPIIEESFNEIILSPGKIGEIVVSGAHVLTGYYRNAEADNLNKIHVGSRIWHRTGDSGYLNSSGELFLTGRCANQLQFPNGVLDIFLIEGWLNEVCGLKGTLIQKDSAYILVIDSEKRGIVNNLLNEFPLLQESTVQLMVISKIPYDPRHASKIDYGKLKEQVRIPSQPHP